MPWLYALAVGTRDLTAHEKAVLEFLLASPFPGRDELREQLATVRTTGLSCQCGCPSIALEVDPSAPPSEAESRDALGHDVDGNLVLVGLNIRHGFMAELDFTDIAASSSTGAVGLPPVQSLRLADDDGQQLIEPP